MRTLLFLVLAAVVAVVVLFATGVFGPSDGSGDGRPSDERSEAPPEGDPDLAGTVPDERPALEEFPLEDELRVLLLAGMPERVSMFLAYGFSTPASASAWSISSWERVIASSTESSPVMACVRRSRVALNMMRLKG